MEIQGLDLPSRPMRIKILYTFDKGHSTTCLARTSKLFDVPVTYATPEKTPLGLIDLGVCLRAVCESSPELAVFDQNDFVVYSVDFTEETSPLVGHGMLSWLLLKTLKSEKHDSQHSPSSSPNSNGMDISSPNSPEGLSAATASASIASVSASASSPCCLESPNLQQHDSDPKIPQFPVVGKVSNNILPFYKSSETLEIQLRFTPTSFVQSDYVNSIKTYRSLADVLPANFDHPEWAKFALNNLELLGNASRQQEQNQQQQHKQTESKDHSLLPPQRKLQPQQPQGYDSSATLVTDSLDSSSFPPPTKVPRHFRYTGDSSGQTPVMPIASSPPAPHHLPYFHNDSPASQNESKRPESSMQYSSSSSSGDPRPSSPLEIEDKSDGLSNSPFADRSSSPEVNGDKQPQQPQAQQSQAQQQAAKRRSSVKDSASNAPGKSKRRATIERSLLDAIIAGEAPAYCMNCGNIKTTAWRRVDDYLLCNPCGLYLTNKKEMRPQHLWDKSKKKKEDANPAPKQMEKIIREQLERSRKEKDGREEPKRKRKQKKLVPQVQAQLQTQVQQSQPLSQPQTAKKTETHYGGLVLPAMSRESGEETPDDQSGGSEASEARYNKPTESAAIAAAAAAIEVTSHFTSSSLYSDDNKENVPPRGDGEDYDDDGSSSSGGLKRRDSRASVGSHNDDMRSLFSTPHKSGSRKTAFQTPNKQQLPPDMETLTPASKWLAKFLQVSGENGNGGGTSSGNGSNKVLDTPSTTAADLFKSFLESPSKVASTFHSTFGMVHKDRDPIYDLHLPDSTNNSTNGDNGNSESNAREKRGKMCSSPPLMMTNSFFGTNEHCQDGDDPSRSPSWRN